MSRGRLPRGAHTCPCGRRYYGRARQCPTCLNPPPLSPWGRPATQDELERHLRRLGMITDRPPTTHDRTQP